MTWITCPKIDKFSHFHHHSLFDHNIIFRVLIWLHILYKISYETSYNVRFSEKHRDVSKTIAKAKMELFVEILSSFQLLTNFTKNRNIVAMGVIHASLEYCSIFWNLGRWTNKYCRTVVCNFSIDHLFYSLMNYLNYSSDCICISYPYKLKQASY